MQRRFLESAVLGAGAAMTAGTARAAVFAPQTSASTGIKITKISFYNPPRYSASDSFAAPPRPNPTAVPLSGRRDPTSEPIRDRPAAIAV